MSLGIWLMAMRDTQVVDKNITHNVVPMWKKAGIYEALYKSEGQTAADVLPVLRNGLMLMRDDPDGFKALNAPNGWGTYDQAVAWLTEVIEGFEANQDGVIGVWA